MRLLRTLSLLLAFVAAVSALVVDPAGASAPLPPPACGATTTTFTQSIPVAIPTGPAVVTSTLVVSGAPRHLRDVDATTFITHTFSADLDITLTSPVGTVVTLTTDNGAGNDNVFNGTAWDDDANPAGQVPYANNNGLVTDHLYANLTPASPLVPEEAMGAFIGEDPNGTWTLTVSDDLAGDGGSLNSWSVDITASSSAPALSSIGAASGDVVAIPTGPAVVTSTLPVSGAPTYLQHVDATTNITHTFGADLDVTLTSPAGTVVTLTTDNGAGNDNVFNGTVWDDDANPAGQVPYTANNGLVTDHLYANLTPASPLVPEEAMGAFIGEDPNGTWTLTVSDDLAGDGGPLNGWSLGITGASCPLRPDARIRRGNGPLVGNNVYNTTGAGQSRSGSARINRTVAYVISVQNDSEVGERLLVRGRGSTPRFGVQYLTAAGADITNRVVSGMYRTPPLAPQAQHAIRAIVTVRPAAGPNASLTRLVSAVSTRDPATRDVVRFITQREP